MVMIGGISRCDLHVNHTDGSLARGSRGVRLHLLHRFKAWGHCGQQEAVRTAVNIYGIAECNLHRANPRLARKTETFGTDARASGPGRVNTTDGRVAFFLSVTPQPLPHCGRRRLMSTPCVRSWHRALCLCSDSTNGFSHCPALPQPLTAAAVLSHNVVQFQTGTAPALIVSTVLRRKPTLLRGFSSVETPSCIYSRLVHGTSKGPNTAGSRCIISSTGAAVSRAALSTFELDRNPTSRRS